MEMITSMWVGEGQVLDAAFAELDIRRAGLGGVGTGELEHLRGHVHAVGETGATDPAGGEQDVDAAAGAQVRDDVAFVQVGDEQGVAAPEGGEDSLGRQPLPVGIGVQARPEDLRLVGSDGGAAAGRGVARSAAATADTRGRIRVALTDLGAQGVGVGQGCSIHRWLSMCPSCREGTGAVNAVTLVPPAGIGAVLRFECD
jgi:hypothetical protein